ncbi:MAG: Xaa-Pro peptidase family protein [Patescibacteria group bacterium]
MDKLRKVREVISENKLDAILISSVSDIVYLTNYNGFSYLEREAFLLVLAQPQGLKHKTPGVYGYILTDGRYSEAVSSIPHFKLLEISSDNSFENILKNLSAEIKSIGAEETDISLAEYKKLKKYFRVKPLKDLRNLRIIKSKDEISRIEQACKLGDKAFEFILTKLKAGVTEKQIAHELEMFVKKSGADISFPPIVAFGKNSSMPHHKSNNEKLITNNIVLLDFGVKLENYCSDMTRTIFFGKADAKFKKIYNTVLSSQLKAINYINLVGRRHSTYEVGARGTDRVVRKYIIKHGFPTIPHSLGHGIGIEVHEPPRLSPKSKDILKPGMVFSIEPGIYISGYGGVRIEDLAVLENRGFRLLTHSPKNLIEI